jgi:hypothetical protein
MRISTTLRLFGDAHAEKVGNPKKKKQRLKSENCKRADQNQNESHEIGRKIELCIR